MATSEDKINKPDHYNAHGFECIEMINEVVKSYDGPAGYCVGSAIKYMYRAPFKHDSPLSDLKKARKFHTMALEKLDEAIAYLEDRPNMQLSMLERYYSAKQMIADEDAI